MLKVIKEAIKGPIIDWNNYLKDYEILALKTNLTIPETTIQHLIDDDRLEISDNKTFEDLVDELKSWLENHKSLTEGIHLLAIVKDNGEIMTIERDTYNSKQAFKKDLKDNGYTVTKILDNRDLKVRETGRFSSFKELEKELKYYTDTFGKDNSLTKELQDLYDEAANIPLTESKKLMEKSLDKVTQYYFDLKDHIKKTIDINKDRENIHLSNQYWKDEDTLNLWKKLKNKIQQNIRLRDTDLKLGVISKEKYEEDNKIDNIMLEYVNNRIKSYKEISKKESVGTSFSNILLERGRNDLLRKSRKESPGRWERREYYKNFRVVNTDITDLDDEDTVVVEFEVGDYKVYVAFSNILLNLREIVKQDPKHMVKFDWVIRACNRAIDQSDVYVRCSCADFKYRFSFVSSKNKYIYGKKELRPADIRNPNDDKGRMLQTFIKCTFK